MDWSCLELPGQAVHLCRYPGEPNQGEGGNCAALLGNNLQIHYDYHAHDVYCGGWGPYPVCQRWDY